MSKPSWQHETIAFSGNTDCYQPLEASYLLTRQCLEACAAARNPVTVITKGALIRRDIDVLQSLRDDGGAHVFVSIPFANEDDARHIEPYASPIKRRFEALAALSAAGISTGIAIAPVIPGLNDSAIPELLERAKDAGVSRAFMILVRLAPEVREVFEARLDEVMGPRAERIRHALQDVRNGDVGDMRFGSRMTGQGPRWRMIESLFQTHARRLGIATGERLAPTLLNPRGNTPLVTLRKKPRHLDTQATAQLGFDFTQRSK